jgi:hypothetical protein
VDACYDRLSNPKNFHGMYKARFEEKGLLEKDTKTVRAPLLFLVFSPKFSFFSFLFFSPFSSPM